MQAHEEMENETHRNFEPPGVQYHNTEESHQQGNNEINNREPVDIVFRDIVVPSSEVRYGGKGEPHLWRESNSESWYLCMAVVSWVLFDSRYDWLRKALDELYQTVRWSS